MRTVNNQGDGSLFGRTDFKYDAATDSYICPGDKKLLKKHTNLKDRYTMYKASSADCGACSLTGAKSEIAIATMAYNFKRISKVLRAATLAAQLQGS
jgi:hypothetical protein